ncbi:MAG: SGNH/GDSL hydrolase family protein [Acidimicrobiia bacterium]
MRRALLPMLLATALLATGLLATALVASGPAGAGSGSGGTPSSGPMSIVQLGDSVAAGEGTLYGYTYDTSSREWTGGNLDATWPGPHPLCHDSPDAYGNRVAAHFGAELTQLACTGATFDNGIAKPEVSDGTTYSPAQFGDWAKQTDLNARYDAAKPDLVLVTLGADDLNFHGVVEECIKNGYEYFLDLADLACTSKNPGSTIKQDVFDVLPQLADNYATLVAWIGQRAKANDQPTPKIVFTNYADPLPPNGAKCPDTSYLYPKQTRYLVKLVSMLNARIESAIDGIDDAGVALADISSAYTPRGVSHRWCSDDPWSYGLSIIRVTDPFSFESQAPFHPTPAGQESIAELVVPAVAKLFG